MSDRIEVLENLVTFAQPLDSITNELKHFSWDYDGSPVVLKATHIIDMIKRFLSSNLTAQELEDWANVIECREDISYEECNEDKLEAIIFKLANPELEGKLGFDEAKQMIDSLSQED